MPSHIKVFRVHRLLAWLYGAFGVFVVASSMMSSHGPRFSAVNVGLLLIFSLIFAAHFFTARACKQGKSGGRTASIIIAFLMLFGFPIGTVIGLYLLANSWHPWVREGFVSQRMSAFDA